MTIKEWQQAVDNWIKDYGVRYFDVKTNTLLLTEEVGEFCRIVARKYGEQSFKSKVTELESEELLAEELSDIYFVVTCLANQLKIDLEKSLVENIAKKTTRDRKRHIRNPKL